MIDRQVLIFPLKYITEEKIEPFLEEEQTLYLRSRDIDESFETVLLGCAQYKLYEQDFLNIGLTYKTFRKIRIISLLETFDIFHLFQNCKQRIPQNGTYLEIGSNTGGSLVCVYEATKDKNINYIAIDPFFCESFVETSFYQNTSHILNLKFYKDISDNIINKIPNKSVDLLFIDGDHTYKGAKMDIINYFPKLKYNGIMLVHDFTSPIFNGVVQAVGETIKNHSFIKLGASTLIWLQKLTDEL